jgi:hypothetical protein
MSSSKINYTEFRKEYNIDSASMRKIVEKLGYEIIREDVIDEENRTKTSEQFIVGENVYGVSNEYILKHAVLEFRRTMNIDNTLQGKFFEYNKVGIVDDNVIEYKVGVSTISPEKVSPKTPSLMRKPNKQTPKIVKVEEETETSIRPIEGMEAITALVAALQQHQPPAAPKDPLLPQKQLLEAAEKGFLITNQQLADLLDIGKQTISSKKSGFIKLGFRYEKIKEGSTTLWKVSQVA